MTTKTQRRHQRKAKAAAPTSTAKTATSTDAKPARIVPFAPLEMLNVRSSKELVLVMGDIISEYHKYHEKTGLVHGNINPQNIMRIPLEPDEPDRYGLRVKGVLLDLDYSPVFKVRQKDGGQGSAAKA